MKSTTFVLYIVMMFIPYMGFSQYNIFGAAAAQGKFVAQDLEINTSLVGLHTVFETPLSTYSMRFGFDYFSRIGMPSSSGGSVSNVWLLKAMGGKLINEGGRVQVPLFAGLSIMTPTGDLEFPEDKKSKFGLSAAGGLRIYISNRFALFGEAIVDGTVFTDYSYTGSAGSQVTSNVLAYNIAGTVGICFVYRQKRDNNTK